MPGAWRSLAAWLAEGLRPGDLGRRAWIAGIGQRVWIAGVGWQLPQDGAPVRVLVRTEQFRREWAGGRLEARGLIGAARAPASLDFLTPAERRVTEIEGWRSELHYARPGRSVDAFAVEVREARQATDLVTLDELTGLSDLAARVAVILPVWAQCSHDPTMTRTRIFTTARAAYGDRLDGRPELLRTVSKDQERRAWSEARKRRSGM